MKKIILSLSLVLALDLPAMAGECEQSIRPDLYQQAAAMAQNARDRMIVEHAEETSRLESSPAAKNLVKCLEKYKNISIAGALKVPSPLDILKAGMDQLGQAACSAVDNLYSDARRATEQRVSLPGSIGGARVGLPGTGELARPSGPSGVQVQPVTRPEGVLRESVDDASSTIRGIFR